MDICISVLGILVGAILGAIATWYIGQRQVGTLLSKVRAMLLNKTHVSLDEEFLMCQLLARDILNTWKKPDIIFAISPGGGLVAEWLSRRLLGSYSEPIPVRTLVMETIRNEQNGCIAEEAHVLDEHSPLSGTKSSRVLLVADISRGGLTLNTAYKYLAGYYVPENIMTATLMCNKASNIRPKFCPVKTDKDVRFDWKDGSRKMGIGSTMPESAPQNSEQMLAHP